MINNGYTWRVGFPVHADANEFAKQLETLKQADGTFDIVSVLDAQRPADAPLHNEIEWDDAAAAYKYRIDFIGQALSALRIIPVDVVREEPMSPIRAVLPTRVVDSATGIPNTYQFVVSTVTTQEKMEEVARKQALGDVRKLANRIASMPGCKDIAEQLLEMIELL